MERIKNLVLNEIKDNGNEIEIKRLIFEPQNGLPISLVDYLCYINDQATLNRLYGYALNRDVIKHEFERSNTFNIFTNHDIVDVDDDKKLLFDCIIEGNTEGIREILQDYDEISGIRYFDGDNLMAVAIKYYNGNPDVIDTLFDCGFFYDEHDFYDGKTPLIYACEVGNFEVVNKLIQYGAEVSGLDSNGKTPLMYACEAGSLEVVKRLINGFSRYNAMYDINIRDNDGKTALMYARELGRQEIIDLISVNKIFVKNDVDDLMEINGYNYDRKSIINKFFELMYKKPVRAIIQDERDAETFELTIRNLDALSKDLDINNACLEYQQNPTEEKKQNLTRVIFEKVGLIRNLQVERQLIGQFIPNRFRIDDRNENITGLINASMNNDFGTYLSRALRTGLQNEFDWENAQQRLIREQQNARQRNNFNNIAQAANNFQQINRDIGILDGRN